MERFYGPDGIVDNPVALAIMEFNGGYYDAKNENEAAYLRSKGFLTEPPKPSVSEKPNKIAKEIKE
jgi:hypothetical protein